MEIREFFETIFGDGAGYATIVTKDARNNPTVQKFFSYPDEIDEMVEYANRFKGEDVYFSPILFYEERRIRENAKSVAVIYADADACPPEKFLLQPSISVETSPNRWHCYWILPQSHDPAQIALLSKKVAYAHKDDGCDLSGWNPTKLLRVPTTSNKKYEATYEVVGSSSGEIYTLESIEAVYGAVKVDSVLDPSLAPMPQPANMTEILSKIPSSPEIMSLYMDEPPAGADMSKRLWKLELELFRNGLSAEEVFSVVRYAKCNKYHRPDRPKRADADGDLWREVQRAAQTYLIDGSNAYVETEPAKREVEKPINFLTDEERMVVASNRTFIDKYVEWAKRKTDAADAYQIASAFTVLSSAFSDTGYAIPKYGKMGLNLWFMILGETTRSRKSTSRQLMLRMVREYEKFAGYQIDVGSDVTAEGLVKLLSNRDKQTSLFHRDEVQGMFKDFINKTYMATAAERFTELYDGHVPVIVRSTGGGTPGKGMQSERAETNFIMYLMGITSKTADVLTTEYFRSGFLARFIYVIADAPDRTYESEAIQQADELEIAVRDEEMHSIVRSLYDAYLYWQKKGAPFPRPLRLTPEALERFNAFKWEMGNFTQGHEQEESIEPSRQRLALSIWKCAVLLAMYDKSDEVQLKHVLIAIHYSEDWFKNLVRMAGAISASEWQREVDSLEALVATKGGRIRYEEAYKRFGNKRKREFDEMVEALKSQGRMSLMNEHNKLFLEVANG